MTSVLIVHGIGNQYQGEMELHAAWYPALCDGLLRAGRSPLPAPADCFCPFYGDLFRPEGHLGAREQVFEEDLEEVGEDEAELLQIVWEAAAEAEPEVPGPEDYGETLLWMPRLAERALNALAGSRYLADHFPLQFFGDLKQVVTYLRDRAIHDRILERVLAHITADTRVVIGHSLGSVIAYEALCANPARVTAFVTLGSPLGLRKVVFEKLTPAPPEPGRGCWPGQVAAWTNLAARGDIVAAQKALAPLFGGGVRDVLIDSGWDAHSSTRYLNTREAGVAVGSALQEPSSPWPSTS